MFVFTSEGPVPCHETMTFKGTVGALGTTAIVLFFAMIFSYVSFKKAERRHQVIYPLYMHFKRICTDTCTNLCWDVTVKQDFS